jgi:hypothetical protein
MGVDQEQFFKEGQSEFLGEEGNSTWKTNFGNGSRSPLVTSNALITDQVLQISQER